MSKFVVKTPFEEWANKDMEASRKRQLTQEDRRIAIEEIKLDMEERVLVRNRAMQNKRQKKRRAKLVQKEIAEGFRDDNGKVKKKQKVGKSVATIVMSLTGYPLKSLQTSHASLKPVDDTPTVKDSVAELSRPSRQFKEDERMKNKQCGRKRINIPRKSTRTNWQAPFLWPPIDAAARKSFPQYSPTEIVRYLHHENYEVYARLHPRTVQRWFQVDRLPGQPVWKDKILKRVQAGNKPPTTIKERGVLVSESVDLCDDK